MVCTQATQGPYTCFSLWLECIPHKERPVCDIRVRTQVFCGRQVALKWSAHNSPKINTRIFYTGWNAALTKRDQCGIYAYKPGFLVCNCTLFTQADTKAYGERTPWSRGEANHCNGPPVPSSRPLAAPQRLQDQARVHPVPFFPERNVAYD